jgi:hypothetical protein
MSADIITLSPEQIDEITAYINEYRSRHQADPIRWSPSISMFTQNWALHLAADNVFEHSGSPVYGENLAFLQGYGNDPMILIKKAVDGWYDEIAEYDFASPGFSQTTGHFTALVWKSTTMFGMGLAINAANNSAYISMNLAPRGNVEGQYVDNVLPLLNSPVPEPSVPIPTPEPVPEPEPSEPCPVPVPCPCPAPEPSVPTPEPSVPTPEPEPSVPTPAPEPSVPIPEPSVPTPEPEPEPSVPTPEPSVPIPAPEPVTIITSDAKVNILNQLMNAKNALLAKQPTFFIVPLINSIIKNVNATIQNESLRNNTTSALQYIIYMIQRRQNPQMIINNITVIINMLNNNSF